MTEDRLGACQVLDDRGVAPPILIGNCSDVAKALRSAGNQGLDAHGTRRVPRCVARQ
jgi:hypothetical protein